MNIFSDFFGDRMKVIFELFLAFFRIGLFTFGGGYAMLPLIERETVEKHEWSTNDEILDIFSMSQCTPGVIAVNSATFIGKKVGGVIGAVAATLGVVAPSIIIITLVATVLGNFSDLEVVQHAFAGIRAAVAALIFASCVKLYKSAVKSKVQLLICVIAFVLVAFFGVSPMIIVIAAGLYGYFFIDLSKIEGKKDISKEGTNNV